jgi:hypothetical protein
MGENHQMEQSMLKAGLAVGIAAILAAGCATWYEDRQVRERQARIGQAKADDAYCVDQGAEFPSEAYTRCRKRLQDDREARQLYRLETLERGDATRMRDPLGPDPVRPSTERGDFDCRERQWEDTRWIDCRVRQ